MNKHFWNAQKAPEDIYILPFATTQETLIYISLASNVDNCTPALPSTTGLLGNKKKK